MSKLIVPRTVTEPAKSECTSHSLAEYRDYPAYVLLGEPGAGKSEAFKQEATACGGRYIEARNFVVEGGGHDWQGEAIFIDGLDEMRADDGGGHTSLNQVRQKLIELGCPSFRLSCREADWLGSDDATALERIAPTGKVHVLHLNPLDEEQIKCILQENHAVRDPSEFIRKADKYGLVDLLHNPQTLGLIAEAVGSNNHWPKSRDETYQLACHELIQEANREHRNARRSFPTPEKDILHAAGYLNAVLLLAGLEGFALDASSRDKSYFLTTGLEGNTPDRLLAALRTRIFIQSTNGERRRPVHRSIAEYLASRYLADLVDQRHLPSRRILALMCGHDGGVVPQLRGLHAWLSVHCRAARTDLIERDPLGVILYGDVRNFSTQDKRHLLQALANEAKNYAGFRFQDWTSHPFGALATPNMENKFHEILSTRDQSEAHQSLLDCILDALKHGHGFSALSDDIENVVRDSANWSGGRRTAMSVLLNNKDNEASRLLSMLEDIRTGAIEDPEDDLLGMLLSKLYPEHVGPDRIFDYLHPAKREYHYGQYTAFWLGKLTKNTPDTLLPSLLDHLAEKKPLHSEHHNSHDIGSMAGQLLTKAISTCGDQIDNQRLYTWLGAGLDRHHLHRLDPEHTALIAAWLSERPDRYKAILKHGIKFCTGQKEPRLCLFDSAARLYGAKAPDDLAQWFLDLSKEEANDEVAEYCFANALHMLIPKEHWIDSELEKVERWVSKHPRFEAWLTDYLTDWLPHWRQEESSWKKDHESTRRQQKEAWLSHFRQNLPAMRQNKAPPKVLHDLAWAYFGHYLEAHGDTPHERLHKFLDNDVELFEATLQGLRSALFRADLPTVDEIIQSDMQGRYHYIRTACLAGAEEYSSEASLHILDLEDAILRRLVAFRLTYNADNTPSWFTLLVNRKPELVAEILMAYGLAFLKAGKKHIPLVYQLSHDQDYASLARHAVPALLNGFPLRARKDQLSDLEELLKAGLRYMDRVALRELLQTRLSLTSLDAAQKVYWLGAGLIAEPKHYEAQLAQHLGRSQARARHLANFLYDRHDPLEQDNELPVSTLGLLIERLAPGCVPERPKDAHWVTPAMQTAELVHALIRRLGAQPGEDASNILARLLQLPNLAHWHDTLHHTLQVQRINWRRTAFNHASVQAVEATLANKQPASHADLLSLLMDNLADIAKKLRDGATNSYKDYWNLDEYGRCEHPKPENECRNTLLAWLQERLNKLGIDAQPEGSYADSKRADIRVWFGGVRHGINIPIEIKRESHPDLWRAIYDQLIPRYTRDPGADGFGIYLVFWFGGKKIPTSPDGERKPKSALELENRLRNSLATEDRYRIQVCVIDCGCPGS